VSILALKAGSTSLKFALFEMEPGEPLATGNISWANGQRQRAKLTMRQRGQEPVRSEVSVPDDTAAAQCALQALTKSQLPDIKLAGHRVVHGGAEFRSAVQIDDGVKEKIRRLGELAPLHNPPALSTIEAALSLLPQVPHAAVFDTTFFSTLPEKAYIYPLPYEWYTDWGIRRFGFHGISHGYCARRVVELMRSIGHRRTQPLRSVICHLGGGCSATAVRDGIAVATTMGFTPLEGLMMGTRCGSVDPSILLHVQRKHGLNVQQLEDALIHRSGLLGVSGLSADLLDIEQAMAAGNTRAKLAFEIFAERVRCAIGALATTLGGLDSLVFTAGIGEHSAAMRALVCEGLQFLGVQLDPKANESATGDAEISLAGGNVRVFVIGTKEELEVARQAKQAVAGQQKGR